jgi:hypothetical protein
MIDSKKHFIAGRKMKTLMLGQFALVGALLSACATQPEDLSTTYVSPLKYSKYDCDQVISEMDYVSKHTSALYASLDKKADNDAAQMGVGLVLFWPTLFFLEGGDGPEAVEYSNLKGDFEALRTVAVKKKCGADSLPKSPEELIKEAEQAKQVAKKEAESSYSY